MAEGCCPILFLTPQRFESWCQTPSMALPRLRSSPTFCANVSLASCLLNSYDPSGPMCERLLWWRILPNCRALCLLCLRKELLVRNIAFKSFPIAFFCWCFCAWPITCLLRKLGMFSRVRCSFIISSTIFFGTLFFGIVLYIKLIVSWGMFATLRGWARAGSHSFSAWATGSCCLFMKSLLLIFRANLGYFTHSRQLRAEWSFISETGNCLHFSTENASRYSFLPSVFLSNLLLKRRNGVRLQSSFMAHNPDIIIRTSNDKKVAKNNETFCHGTLVKKHKKLI